MANDKTPDQLYKDFSKLVNKVLPTKIGAILVEHAHENIETGTDINGNRFVSRKQRKRKKGSRSKRNNRAILVDTGRMKRNVKKKVRNGAVSIQAEPYAEFHQKGGKHLPQREFIGVGERAAALISKKVENELNDFLKGFGFKKT